MTRDVILVVASCSYNSITPIAMKILRSFYPALAFVLSSLFSFAQTEKYLPQVIPVPPSAFQFLKYGEIPVNEYSGIMGLEIPIYTIKEGSLNFPITLNYHGGGVRVAEEATWVGLSWNLDLGNVTQIVNDKDDFGGFQYLAPDYHFFASKTVFPPYYQYPFTVPGPTYTPSTGISASNPVHSLAIFTDHMFPVNGSYGSYPQITNADGGPDDIDSEPDVFKASFNGHSLEFLKDPATGTYKILNRKNYKIVSILNTDSKASWKIIAPDGVQYFFEQIDEVLLNLSTTVVRGSFYGNGLTGAASRTWHLTKIIGTDGKVITFNWTRTSGIKDISSFSQIIKYKTPTDDGSGSAVVCSISAYYNDVGPRGADALGAETINSYTMSKTQPVNRSYPTSITFSLGQLSFVTSVRQDNIGELKLDSINLQNSRGRIKSYSLQYDYFVGHSNGGSIEKTYPTSNYFNEKTQTELTYRLKLVSIKSSDAPAYQFTYDNTTLPLKTSYAVDYWGFYNGKTANTSMIPNPTHIGVSTLSDNGNNRNSDITYAKAGLLTEVLYPTGGRSVFEYELNTISIPSIPTITSGAGVRIKTVKNFIGSNLITTTKYTYEGGKPMLDLHLYGTYQYSNISIAGTGNDIAMISYPYLIQYLTGNNYYSSSLLGSGNFVGYDKVTKESLDQSNVNNGKTITTYTNQPDEGKFDSYTGMSLPARKNHWYPHNGLILKQHIYNKQNQLISRDSNIYEFQISEVFYGMKSSFHNTWFIAASMQGTCYTWSYGQELVGYYPLYNGESLLTFSETKQVSGTNSIAIRKTLSYYPDNQQQLVTTTNSSNESLSTEYVYSSTSGNPYMSNLRSLNILNRPIETLQKKNGNTLNNEKRYYSQFNGLYLPSQISDGPSGTQSRVSFGSYDAQGNILEMHRANDASLSFIWSYNNTLPIAEVSNAAPAEIAFTSFENGNNEGGWTFNQASNTNSKTGSFSFAGTSLSKSLPAGNYTLSFWAKRNSVNGSISGSVTQSITSDQWTYYTFSLSNISSVALTLSNVLLDEVRVHPQRSQMKSYTHKPLVGITSVSDANGVITYFEYDSQNRLLFARDKDGNIVKNYVYHYKGEN